MVYAFLESTLQLDTRLENNYALGAGPSIGALIDLSDALARRALCARVSGSSPAIPIPRGQRGCAMRYTLEREWALRLDLSRERQEKQAWNTVLLSLHHYFCRL